MNGNTAFRKSGQDLDDRSLPDQVECGARRDVLHPRIERGKIATERIDIEERHPPARNAKVVQGVGRDQDAARGTIGSIRLCRGPGAVMYMGSHNSVSQLRVFQWADTSTTIALSNVNVRPWTAGAYSAPGPGGVNWLGRLDPRITGAWVGNGTIGFMWSANRDTNHPLPYIRVVRIKETTKALVDEPDIWSRTSAWAYPAAAANSQGAVGISAFYGGGTRHPGHVVGVKSATGWDTQLSKTSTHGPPEQAWGDYLSCIAHHADGTQWVASGYTLQGGTSRKNVEPRYVRFRS